eukprot:UN19636
MNRRKKEMIKFELTNHEERMHGCNLRESIQVRKETYKDEYGNEKEELILIPEMKTDIDPKDPETEEKIIDLYELATKP